MSSELRQRILLWSLAAAISIAFGYFIIDQLKLESQVDDLKLLCGRLKPQSTVDEVQSTTIFTPGLRMILLDPSPDGSQIGSIIFEGLGRGGCNITFMRGRLAQKSFSYGSMIQESGKPQEPLKPW